MNTIARLAPLAALVLAGASCLAFDNAVDCQKVCSTYSDCFDSSYDVEACQETCVEDSRDDEDYRRQVNICEACIEGTDCVQGVFECGSDCDNIVD